MSEDINKIISKYKMYMSFDGNEYEVIQKRELNKLLDYIQQKENIIKEVREYTDFIYKQFEKVDKELITNRVTDISVLEKILEILDEENKDIELDMLKALNTDLDDDVEMG